MPRPRRPVPSSSIDAGSGTPGGGGGGGGGGEVVGPPTAKKLWPVLVKRWTAASPEPLPPPALGISTLASPDQVPEVLVRMKSASMTAAEKPFGLLTSSRAKLPKPSSPPPK